MFGASQIWLRSVSRRGRAEFNVIYSQLMDMVWLHVCVNTAAAENGDVARAGCLGTAASISDFLLLPSTEVENQFSQ